jgi:hypothetical protein
VKVVKRIRVVLTFGTQYSQSKVSPALSLDIGSTQLFLCLAPGPPHPIFNACGDFWLSDCCFSPTELGLSETYQRLSRRLWYIFTLNLLGLFWLLIL